jgi:hypothetical protein
LNMSSADVMHFLGRKLLPSLNAGVVTDTKHRPDGWRVKHRLARNWVKVYDKVSVLRVETTINNPRKFRILRVFKDAKGRSQRRWCPMNKGVANLWRYLQVGMASNRRYLTALAAAPLKGKGVAALDALCRPHTKDGRHHARFDPLRPADRALFRAVLAGGNVIVGFPNADLVARLYPHPPYDPTEALSPLRPGITSHRQAPRSWTSRQSPTPTPVPTHPPTDSESSPPPSPSTTTNSQKRLEHDVWVDIGRCAIGFAYRWAPSSTGRFQRGRRPVGIPGSGITEPTPHVRLDA